MEILNTKSKKKSFTLTVILFSLFLLLLFVLKMGEPNVFEGDRGVAVNFGTMDFGSGDTQPLEPVKTAPVTQQEETPPVAEDTTEEDVITQDVEDAPVISDTKPKQTEAVKPKEDKPKEEEPKEPVIEKPKPDASTNNALNSLLNGPENDGTASSQGEGDDATGGDKGNPNGDPNSEGYYGNGGSGGNGNYRLGGRSALSKPMPKQKCNQYGRVTIKVWVNRSGKVIKAAYILKGTDNTAPCLINAVLKAAKSTKWSPKADAPSTQTGTIIYNVTPS